MAEQTLTGFVDEVLDVLCSIADITTVAPEPTGQVQTAPFATVYTTDARDKQGPGSKITSLDNVTIAVMVHQTAMNRWYSTLLPMRETVPQALVRQQQGDGFRHAQNWNDIALTFGPIDWGEVRMFGWLFTIEQVLRTNNA